MKKNFILFALMLFLPILAFAQPTITINNASVEYDGTNKLSVIGITTTYDPWSSRQLTVRGIGRDYVSTAGELTVSLSKDGESVTEAIDAGTYTVTAVFNPRIGQNSTSRKTFTITPKSIEGLAKFSAGAPDYTYDGKSHVPSVEDIVVMDGQTILTENEDYTIDFPTEAINADEYSITITGLGNYAKFEEPAAAQQDQAAPTPVTDVLKYSIKPKSLAGMLSITGTNPTVNGVASYTYDAQAHPAANDVTVQYLVDGQNIITSRDYNVTITKNGEAVEATPTAAGSYVYTITPANGNYSEKAEQTYLIGRNAIVINAAQIWKWYGEKDSEARSTVTGEAANYVDFTIDSNSSTLALQPDEKAHILNYLEFSRANGDNGENAGSHDYMIVAKPDMTGCNYAIQIQHNTSKLVIQKRPITVSVNDPLVAAVDNTWKYYMEQDPKFTPVLIDGELQYNEKIADVVTITRETGEDVGSYAFSATSDNYDVTLVDEAFEIKERPNSNATLEYTSVIFDGRYKTPKVTVKSKVNNVEVTLQEGEGKDYTVEYDNNRNVTDYATATVIFNEANFPNEANQTLYFKITKRDLHVKVQSFSDETGAQNTNYNVQPNSQKINFIYYDSFGVKADNYNKSEAKEDVEGEGFVRPTVSLVATNDPTVYNLKVTGGSAKNYKFVYDNTGVLTILRAKFLQITVSGEKFYGEKDPKFVVEAEGWELGESAAQIDAILKPNGTDYAFKMVRDAGEDAGNYAITITGPSVLGNEGTGYNVQYIDGGFKIKRRPITITANNVTKTYGDADPYPYPVTIGGRGLANGDTEEDILSYSFTYTAWEETDTWPFRIPVQQTATVPVYDVTRNAGEDVDVYNLTNIAPNRWARYNENLNNYDIEWTVSNHKLTIVKRALTIYPIDGEKVYGDADPDFATTNVKVEGLQFGQTPAQVLQVNGHYIYKVTRNAGENVGEYTLTIADNKVYNYETVPFTLQNYTYTYAPTTAKFKITAKPLIVKALDQTIPYATDINKYYIALGTVNEDGSVTYVNKKAHDIIANNDQVQDVIELSTDITKVGTHEPSENPYKYTLKNSNYTIAEEDFVQGYLTIGRLPYLPLDERDLATLTKKSVKDLPLSQVINDHDGATLDVYLPGRSMIMEQWYTFVLPFDIRVSELSKALDYAVVDMLDPAKTNGYTFEIAMANIPANTPFLVQVADNHKGEIEMRNITIAQKLIKAPETELPEVAAGDYKFVASYDSFKGLASNTLRMQHTSPTAKEKFVVGNENSAIRETEGWLELPAGVSGADVRIVIEEPNGTTTVIEGIGAENEAEGYAEGWYTVTGVKLDAKPTTSGTYIFNGKKVYIK